MLSQPEILIDSCTPGFQPEVSIVVPYHRAIPDIACLQSLADQAGSPAFEVILIDNSRGRLPESSRADLLERVAGLKTTTIRWVHVEAPDQPGAGYARNAGLRVATGAWIGMLDSDDAVERDWIAGFCAAQKPGACIVPPMVKITSRGEKLPPAPPLIRFADAPEFPEVMVTSWFVETSRLRKVGGWSNDLLVGEDFELAYRLIQSGSEVIRTASGAYLYATPERLGDVLSRGAKYAWDDLCVRELYGRQWTLPFHGGNWGRDGVWLVRRTLMDSLRALRLRSWHPLLEPAKQWAYLAYKLRKQKPGPSFSCDS